MSDACGNIPAALHRQTRPPAGPHSDPTPRHLPIPAAAKSDPRAAVWGCQRACAMLAV